MKKYLFFLFSFITSLSVISCQDEDFGYTEEEIFRNAYERNFEAKYGKIDPNQSWDLSSYAKEQEASPSTRAANSIPTDADGFYHVEQGTINWIESKLINGSNHADLGDSFGLLMGAEEFTLIPVYQNGASNLDWELHMVLVTKSTAEDKTLWSKSHRDKFQIMGEGGLCADCSGRGMIAGEPEPGQDRKPCNNCFGSGYVKGTDHDCPNIACDNGFLHVTCTKCNVNHEEKCGQCDGLGYRINFYLVYWQFVGCTNCGGEGIGHYIPRGNGYKQGSGMMPCTVCGGDGIKEVQCEDCGGDGTMSDCPICRSKGYGIQCPTCKGSGSKAEGQWTNIAKTDNTYQAKAIRATPWNVNTGLSDDVNFTNSTDGNLVYFYLKVGRKNQTSLDSKMVILDCPRPTNIDPNYEVKVIGCEDTSNDNDFNDLVFLVIGRPKVPTVVLTSESKPVTLYIKKRYMIEDMGSSVDWDFNDIVVDVTRTTTKTLNSGYTKYSEAITTKAMVINLCGTLPIKVKIGNTWIPKTTVGFVTDPTNQEQTLNQLFDQKNPGKSEYNGTPSEITPWSPNYECDVDGWNPDTNNITVYVKQKKNANAQSDDQYWEVQFPEKGSTPYIIATDQNVLWKGEGVDIDESWWNPSHDTSILGSSSNSN